MNWALLQNSLIVSGAVALLSTALGFLAALRMASLPAGWRKGMLVIALATLALPPFLIVNTWLDLLGPNSLLQRWLPLNLFSLGGTIAVLTAMYWPISAILILGAWGRIEPAQLESDPALRGGALLRWLLWPAARGSIGLAAVLTFVLALNQFSVPVILQVQVLPEDLWLAFTTRLDDAGAWTAAWPMIVAPILILAAFRHSHVAWPRQTAGETVGAFRRQLGTGWLRISNATAIVLTVLSFGVPLGHLTLAPRTWMELPTLLRASPDVLWNSFLLAGLTATVTLAVGLAMWRWKWGVLLWLVFFIPGILLGRAMIPVFSSTVFYGTFVVVMVAFALRYLAVSWQGAVLARRAVDSDLVDVGRLEGARGWTLFRSFTWPQMSRPSAATWYVVYLLSLWDVETLVLIYPPGGETMALRIFNLLHYGHNAQVNAMCVALLALAVAPLFIWSVLAMVKPNPTPP